MKKRFSIVAVFGGISLGVLMIVLLVLSSMIYSLSIQNELQADFVARVNAADSVVMDLHKMENDFSQYKHSLTSESHHNYIDRCVQLTADLDFYASLCAGVTDTQNYIRRIRNFNDYQMEMIAHVDGDAMALYNITNYLMLSLNLHQQQAREMAQIDLLLSSAEYDNASSTVRLHISVIIIVLLLFALFLIILMIKTYFTISKMLQTVNDHFKELAVGNWEIPDLIAQNWKEFDVLSGMINHMKHEIKDYIAQVKAKSQLEKQLNEERLLNEQQRSMLSTAQLSSLRAQVNPHFLFNALNLIGVTAMVDTSEAVMQLVEVTGSILRYSLYNNDIMTQLDQEVEIVQRYLFLQKRRFGDALTVEIHNEMEGEDYLIPTMTIQPVIENCFKHGFGNKKKLHINLFIVLDGDQLQIRVTDNGVGFDTSKRSEEKGEGGIGLENIRQRLALQYGIEKAYVKIESKQGAYTTVTLYIPAKKE